MGTGQFILLQFAIFLLIRFNGILQNSIGFYGIQLAKLSGANVITTISNDEKAEIELTYNWDGDNLGEGSRNFGHLAYRVENIYETCQRLMDMGYTINRPPRDGHMAFVRSPDKISVEILQEGNLEPKEPWASMQNIGTW